MRGGIARRSFRWAVRHIVLDFPYELARHLWLTTAPVRLDDVRKRRIAPSSNLQSLSDVYNTVAKCNPASGAISTDFCLRKAIRIPTAVSTNYSSPSNNGVLPASMTRSPRVTAVAYAHAKCARTSASSSPSRSHLTSSRPAPTKRPTKK